MALPKQGKVAPTYWHAGNATQGVWRRAGRAWWRPYAMPLRSSRSHPHPSHAGAGRAQGGGAHGRPVQELCLKRFSGHGVRGGAKAITNGAAALQVCCTLPNAVLYQPVVSGGH
eukprot:scaffold23756_cov45-Phaeocystis_antarctica.AAC.2